MTLVFASQHLVIILESQRDALKLKFLEDLVLLWLSDKHDGKFIVGLNNMKKGEAEAAFFKKMFYFFLSYLEKAWAMTRRAVPVYGI